VRTSTIGYQQQTPTFAQNVGAFLRAYWIYGLVAILFASNIMFGIALYKSPLIAKALSQGADIQIAAYENRIAHLRTELDRLHSRQYAKSGDINLQMQELVAQQELLMEQHDYVKNLAEKAKSLGLDVQSNTSASIRPAAIPTLAAPSDIAQVADHIQEMQTESLLALTAIAKSAEASSNTIAKELKRAGLSLQLNDVDVGGPYIPATADMDALDHIDAANAAMNALSRFQAARKYLSSAPIHRPLASKHKYSSRFGNRRDPFTGKSAFHSGLDFRAPSGTAVKSVGYGRVTFAGRKGGYGNTVEVTHSNGLVSRYAHLSKISVKKGVTVSANTTIGLVGSTGRSTGPHLHLELRKNDQPLDPDRFIRVGAKLSKYL
jgi:murein DD-endopeptidase MepM/ murein hydrolase activator NlpD